MSITQEELMHEVCGLKPNGEPKCLVTLATQIVNPNEPDMEPIDRGSDDTINAEVQIYPSGNFTVVDLKFPTDTDMHLSSFFRIYEDYLHTSDEMNENAELVNSLSLLPQNLYGSAMVTAVYPLFWALEPEKVGAKLKTLRIIYLADNVLYMESALTKEQFERYMAQAQDSILKETEWERTAG